MQMKILNEPFNKQQWTKALSALPVNDQCIEADLIYKGTLRTTATRLQQKTDMRYSFECSKTTVKVWRIA